MYETEEQQVEALKKWWKENGKSIVGGVVIGLAAVFGWQQWNVYQDRVGAQASNAFDQLTLSVEQGDDDAAAKQAEILHQEFGSTPYDAFTYLLEARLAYERKDAAAARTALENAIANAPDESLETIAVLRLARLELDAGNADGAAAILDRHRAPDAFAGEYAAVRGDIARAKGDLEAARAFYQEAIEREAGNTDLVQLKLENLPPAS